MTPLLTEPAIHCGHPVNIPIIKIDHSFSLPMNLKPRNFPIAETDSLSPLGERAKGNFSSAVGATSL